MLLDRINNYIQDPENAAVNYALGKEYELLEQYSSAAGYFLRAADRTEDTDLIYDSIVSAARTLLEHGDNFKMVMRILRDAIKIDSSRPEAFYFMCLTYKYLGNASGFENFHPRFLEAKQDNEKSEIYNMPSLSDIVEKKLKMVETVRSGPTETVPQNDFIQKIQREYEIAVSTPSDINEHLPVLYDLAKECNHITEMGVRTGVSTRAFLMSNAKLISYDIVTDPRVVELVSEARAAGKDATFIEADVLKIDIEETDLLFIDTWHEYEQLKQELARHANKARKYIAFHDTNTYGLKNEGGDNGQPTQGLLPAIIEFLIENRNWQFKMLRTNNNGLSVIERVTV